MLQIIKYQLKGSKDWLLLRLGVLAVVNLAAWGFAAKGMLSGNPLPPAGLGFWIPVAVTVTVVTAVVSFFICGSGHVNDLLYRNTNYLMLTIPRRGWEILGGRFIAGLIEFLAIAVPVFVIMSVGASLGAIYTQQATSGFVGTLGFIWRQIFLVNTKPTIILALLGLCVFTSAGFALTFAAVASRSFVKNRKLATVATIAIFIFVSNRAAVFGEWLSEKLNWFLKVPVFVQNITMNSGGSHFPGPNVPNGAQELNIPIATFLCFLAIALVLFAAASWLMEKKVEL